MYTNKTFEDVREKVENDVYRVYSAYETAAGLYVELRGDGSKVDGTGVSQLEYYMKNKEEFNKVKDKY